MMLSQYLELVTAYHVLQNILYDPDNLDDFGTLEDEIGKKCLEAEAERKRKE